jgi:segregation and condensation protein B
MSMNHQQLKNILEATLLTAGRPLSIDQLLTLFTDDEMPSRDDVRKVLNDLDEDLSGRGVELKQVSSGYRIQVRKDLAPWIARLSEERPVRYSRALLETLALIVYRQPITRAEIEEVRGVTVSSSIIKTMLDRKWIKVVGHREVPGKPALYGTTRQFLDYFNLKSLSELPPLAEIRSIDDIQRDLHLEVIDDAEVGDEPDEGNEDGEQSNLDKMLGDDEEEQTKIVNEKPGKSISATTA